MMKRQGKRVTVWKNYTISPTPIKMQVVLYMIAWPYPKARKKTEVTKVGAKIYLVAI